MQFCNKKASARHYFSRKLKWDPSDFSGEKSRGGFCLRLPGYVLRPLRHTTSRCYAVRHGYRNDLTPCRMALYFDYASAHAPTPSKHPASTATRGSSYTAPLALRFLYSFNDVLNFTRIISFFCDVGEEFPSPHTSNLTNFGGGFI